MSRESIEKQKQELIEKEKREILEKYSGATNEELMDLLALNFAYMKILSEKIDKFVGR
ncbi:MAG: hypothetical protein ACRCVJ_08285 [Clostridium sp.]|uniref:hypothetical protein n=1 Tax=Clostridium sp. TaxID=1506 RepID=UPI003F3854D9